MKQTLATFFVSVLFASVAHADLRYTTHTDVRLTPVPTVSEPAFTQATTLLQSIMPAGNTRTYINDQAARIEPTSAGSGPIVLLRSDGETILDPATRTYWRLPAQVRDAFVNGVAEPRATYRRTGEFATVLGLRAERVVASLSLSLPIAPPPGFPTALTLEGELWIASAYAAYANAVGRLAHLLPGPVQLEGLVLKYLLRNTQFGYEAEYSVTELVEAPLAPSLFDVPTDYREVSADAHRTEPSPPLPRR